MIICSMHNKNFLWLVLFLLPLQVKADAIMRSTAMFAETIAEYFVEEGYVRLELEIGQGDIASFRNLLPDEIYQQLGYGSEPFPDRQALFFERDMVIMADGVPLKGFIQAMGPATRSLRDEVTGEELPTAEEDAVVVIAVSLVFPLEDKPASLSLTAPGVTGLANIGFVLYHMGIAVNDFRFLTSGYQVKLDWEDAWYSTFTQRALKRQYDSPMSGFIYVEPFEVRKEIIIRPHDLQQWTDLGLEGLDVIPATQQDEVKRRAVEFLKSHFAVSIDGVPVQGNLDRVNFLQRTLKSSTVIDNQDIDVLSATLGLIYVFPTDGLPQNVEMDWDLFSDKMQKVSVASVDQAGPLPSMLEPDYSVLRWDNYLKYPEIPTLVEVREPPTALQKFALWGRWVALALSLILAVLMVRKWQSSREIPYAVVAGLALALVVAVLLERQSEQAKMNPDRLQQLTADLLHNIYRAFDYRGEEVIYDVLARSAAGDMLTDVYLETRRGLELVNQGGARVKVKDVEVLETRLLDTQGTSMTVESRWQVSGSVGHWGHVHQRSNAYHADLEISEVDGSWRLTGLEILQEERL